MSDRKVLQVRLVSLGDGDGIPERRVLLAAGQDVTIGRASTNRGVAASADNTKINNPVISKEHATLTTNPAGTTVFIRDLRSMHGTRVNDRELAQGESCAIFSGSALQFGSTVIRGNATFKPAKYNFYVELVNTANAFSTPTATSMPQSESFSDIKKGYCDDSSLYSDYDSQEDEDYQSNKSHDEMDVIQDTYTSDQDSEASRDVSVHSSSDDSDNSDGSDDISIKDYCPAYPALDAALDAALEADTSSTAVVHDSAFSSSCVDECTMLGERVTSAQPWGTPMGIDVGIGNGDWPEYSEADHSVFLASGSAAPTSETAENFDFNMDVDETRPTKNAKIVPDGHNKARPFSNSINELCEPVPEVDTALMESDVVAPESDAIAPESEDLKGALTQAGFDLESSPSVDRAPLEADEPETKMASTTIKLSELVQVESARSKRSAAEAELDAESIPEVVGSAKANQIATPQQMSNRRIASITRRARDLSIGVVVGGVAVFTVLASMGEGA